MYQLGTRGTEVFVHVPSSVLSDGLVASDHHTALSSMAVWSPKGSSPKVNVLETFQGAVENTFLAAC